MVSAYDTLKTMLAAVAEHFTASPLRKQVFLNRNLFELQQNDVMSCLVLTSQVMGISNKCALIDFTSGDK